MNMIKPFLILSYLLFCSILFNGCTTAYESVDDSIWGLGYSEVWLDKKTVKIFYSDVGISKPARGRELAEYRAAELTLLKDYSRLVFLNVEDDSEASNGNDIPLFFNNKGSVIVRMIEEEDLQWESALDAQDIVDRLKTKYELNE